MTKWLQCQHETVQLSGLSGSDYSGTSGDVVSQRGAKRGGNEAVQSQGEWEWDQNQCT